jgi:polysaccharide transporter, PST family
MPQKYAQNPSTRQIITNIAWLTYDRLIRILLGLLVGVWIARYLGPQEFGKYSYAFAFISIFGAMTPLGLHPIVVRDIVRDPSSARDLIGNAFVLYAGFSLAVTIVICLVFVPLLNQDQITSNAIILLSGTLVIKSTDLVKTWFEARIQSKFVALVESSSFIVASLLKVALILTGASIIDFVWTAVIEAILIAGALLWGYHTQVHKLWSWTFLPKRATTLLGDSWPLMLSGLTIVIYMRIDQIMLGEMLGHSSVGIYSAAVRISEAWYFLPTTITASLYPAIAVLKSCNIQAYKERNQQLFSMLVWLAIVTAALTTLLSNYIVTITFGESYMEATNILVIHVWSAIFVFLGVASNNWLVNEDLQKLAFVRAFLGAIINILCNLVLIPDLGATGAALGTLIAQFFSSYLFDLTTPRTRELFWMKSRAFSPFLLLRALRAKLRA